MIEDLFVKEMVRIIKLGLKESRFGPTTVVFVSEKCYHAAKVEADRNARILGKESRHSSILTITTVPVAPMPWLSGYEFEIRHNKNWYLEEAARARMKSA